MLINLSFKGNARTIRAFYDFARIELPSRASELSDIIITSRNGLSIEIEPLQESHTREQQAYFHKYCREFGKYTGNTPDEIKEVILREHFGTEVVPTKFGDMLRPVKRSSDAKRIEYSELIDTLIRVAAEMDFVIPPPATRAQDGR